MQNHILYIKLFRHTWLKKYFVLLIDAKNGSISILRFFYMNDRDRVEMNQLLWLLVRLKAGLYKIVKNTVRLNRDIFGLKKDRLHIKDFYRWEQLLSFL